MAPIAVIVMAMRAIGARICAPLLLSSAGCRMRLARFALRRLRMLADAAICLVSASPSTTASM